MKSHKRKHLVTMLVVVLALGVLLLGACGTDSPTGSTVQTKSSIFTGGTATVGLTPCTSCHTVQTAAWLASKHGNANLDPAGSEVYYTAECTVCHEPNGEGQETVTGTTGTAPRVGCEACHGGGSLHVAGGGMGPIGFATLPAETIGTTSSLAVSAQFRTCTACHGLVNTDDPLSASPTPTTPHGAFTSSAQVITDTHFATYLTTFGANTPLAGYAMDYNSSTICIDCHDPHGTADINREWQQSAHADVYGGDKGYTRGAWARTNFSCNATSTAGACGTTSYSDRTYCQRCHTTDGFAALANALGAGNTDQARKIMQADRQFTFSGGVYTPLASSVVYTTAGWKPQMLKCNGCHTDFKGTLRNPGAFPAIYDLYTVTKNFGGPATSIFVSGVNEQYPDVFGSNICVACHSGRESGETIKALNSDPTLSAFDLSAKAYFSPHELTGAGTVFGKTGYEYGGRSYADNSSYRHKNIGTSREPGTGSNGPCVGCHMSRPNKNGNHLFMPVSRAFIDPAGPFVSKQSATIVGIASEVCFTCHGPNDNVILEMVKEQKLLYAEAIEAVVHVAEESGYFWNEGSYLQRNGTVLRSGPGAAVVTNGSFTVTMAALNNSPFTDWQNANVQPGDQFSLESSGTYTIASVDSGTQITLTDVYSGTSATGRYTIVKPADTVTVTNGDTLVTGATASWLGSGSGITANASAGSADHFRVDSDGTWYQIVARTATTLTLAKPYAGPTAAGASYTVRRFRNTANAITNWLTPPDTDVNGNGTGKNNMGASFNMYIMESDPAGYVHNRYYMKRLMYDSIDWLDDNDMNYSTGTTLNTACSGGTAPVWCSGAMSYILPNSIISGSAAERP